MKFIGKLLLTLLLLGFPVLDTITVMVERIASGRPPFSPDKNHFHHKLMRLGLFHTEAVVAIYAITALLTAAAYLLRFQSDWLLFLIYAGFCALVVAVFTAAVVPLLIGLTNAQTNDWLTPPVGGLIALSAILAAIFVLIEFAPVAVSSESR